MCIFCQLAISTTDYTISFCKFLCACVKDSMNKRIFDWLFDCLIDWLTLDIARLLLSFLHRFRLFYFPPSFTIFVIHSFQRSLLCMFSFTITFLTSFNLGDPLSLWSALWLHFYSSLWFSACLESLISFSLVKLSNILWSHFFRSCYDFLLSSVYLLYYHLVYLRLHINRLLPTFPLSSSRYSLSRIQFDPDIYWV